MPFLLAPAPSWLPKKNMPKTDQVEKLHGLRGENNTGGEPGIQGQLIGLNKNNWKETNP